MGYYAEELKEATTLISENSFKELLTKIKETVKNDRWAGYGWRDKVLDAASLDTVLNEFGIKLAYEGDSNYRPVIKSTYMSDFFRELIKLAAPYMADGNIQIDAGYAVLVVIFENGNVEIL